VTKALALVLMLAPTLVSADDGVWLTGERVRCKAPAAFKAALDEALVELSIDERYRPVHVPLPSGCRAHSAGWWVPHGSYRRLRAQREVLRTWRDGFRVELEATIEVHQETLKKETGKLSQQVKEIRKEADEAKEAKRRLGDRARQLRAENARLEHERLVRTMIWSGVLVVATLVGFGTGVCLDGDCFDEF